MDPEVFIDPMKFDPTRWFTEDEEKLTKMKYYYVPFGRGSRNCPGYK